MSIEFFNFGGVGGKSKMQAFDFVCVEHETERSCAHGFNAYVDPNALSYAIKRSCENKAEVVSLDEKEDVDMSYRLGWIDDSLVKRVHNIVKQARLSLGPPESVTVNMFKAVMAVDKKVADGLLKLILLKGPLGNCVFTGHYDRKALDETLHAFCKS